MSEWCWGSEKWVSMIEQVCECIFAFLWCVIICDYTRALRYQRQHAHLVFRRRLWFWTHKDIAWMRIAVHKPADKNLEGEKKKCEYTFFSGQKRDFLNLKVMVFPLTWCENAVIIVERTSWIRKPIFWMPSVSLICTKKTKKKSQHWRLIKKIAMEIVLNHHQHHHHWLPWPHQPTPWWAHALKWCLRKLQAHKHLS